MKSMKKRIVLVMMVFVFTLMASVVASAKTYRETIGRPINLEQEYILYTGPVSGLSDVKISNKKIASLVIQKDEAYVYVTVKLKKVGVTNISYKVKKGGKTDTYKIKFCVYKYKNPFKELKIGTFSYKSQFSGGEYSTLMQGKGKVTVKVKAAGSLKAFMQWVKAAIDLRN